jgi:type II secretory pathway pseudopilin PulG
VKILKRLVGRFFNEAGIGLVESLVAIAILGVGVTAFLTDLSAGSMAVKTQNESVTARGLAQNQMEIVKAAPYDFTGTSYTPITAPSGYAVTLSIDSNLYSNEDIQKIAITVEHDNNVIITLEDYKVDR